MVAMVAMAWSSSAHSKTVEFGFRPGGHTVEFIRAAKVMLKSRDRIVIRRDQMSAAAIQVVWYRKHGGKVCTKGDVQLFFHMGRNMRTGEPIDSNRFYLGRSIPEGWYRPAEFGIPKC